MQAFIKEFYEFIVYNQSLHQSQIKVKAIFLKTTKIQIISQKIAKCMSRPVHPHILNFKQIYTHTCSFINGTKISSITSITKIHSFIFTKSTRLLLEVPTRH